MTHHNQHIPKRIAFIGFMGTGKSTVGKEIAHILGYEFIDIDEQLKNQEGLSISEIFHRSGEIYFREIEKVYLQGVIKKTGIVLSCGGGIIINKQNRELLRQTSYVVWLQNSIETSIARCMDSDRPLLNVNGSIEEVQKLLDQRLILYRTTANLTIHTDNRSVMEVVEQVYATITSLTDLNWTNCNSIGL